MITGFNTNVRYRGRMFHVQTEDSGRNNPHIISHLYYEGTILASQRRDYSDCLDSESLENEVRALMEAQHKSLLARLKAAEFDEVIAQRLDGQPLGDGVAEAITSPALDDEDVAPQPEVEPETATAPQPEGEPQTAAPSEPEVEPEATREPQTEAEPETVVEPEPATAAEPSAPDQPRAFGEGIVSHKPLDEVILDYLVQKARDRRPRAGGSGAGSRRPSRAKG